MNMKNIKIKLNDSKKKIYHLVVLLCKKMKLTVDGMIKWKLN